MKIKENIPKAILCANPLVAYFTVSLLVTHGDWKRTVEFRSENIHKLKDGPVQITLNGEAALGNGKSGTKISSVQEAMDLLTEFEQEILIGDYSLNLNEGGVFIGEFDTELPWEDVQFLAACDPNKPGSIEAILKLNERDDFFGIGSVEYNPIPRWLGLKVGCQNIPWAKVHEIAALAPNKATKAKANAAKPARRKKPAATPQKKAN